MNYADKILENDKIGMYSFFDRTFNAYNSPFCARSDREALKVCRDILKLHDDSITINADVISLYRVGVFDQQSGLITSELTELIKLDELIPKEVIENA